MDCGAKQEHATDGQSQIAGGGRGTSGGALVEVEQSAEPLRFADAAISRTARLVRERNDIGEALVIAFVLVMSQIFFEGRVQGTLAEHEFQFLA